MNFSEYLFQQMQKYHTKPSDTLILIFSSIVALATLVLIGLTISEKNQPNLLILSANIIILIVLLIIIIYIYFRIPKTNDRIQQIEHAIIINQNMIDNFSIDRKERILLLIEEVLTKTQSSKETEGLSRDDKFNELMNYLKTKPSAPSKDPLSNFESL